MLDEIKELLGIEGIEKDKLLNQIINVVSKRILTYVGIQLFPADLEWILIEITCVRYNMLGSEGIHSEQNEGIKYIYIDNLLDPYREYLDAYISDHGLRRKGFKML